MVVEVLTAIDSGAPLHMHHIENEWFYAPRLVPHTWHDVGETPGRMLVVAQPAGGMEGFAKDLIALGGTGVPDRLAMRALFAKYHMEMLGPPLPKKQLR